jgi:Tfp pilus assembly protein PilN
MRPQGIPLEAFELQAFFQGGERHLVMAREDALHGFLESLPPSLASLWTLEAGPLALLPSAGFPDKQEWTAALMVDAEATHLLFFRYRILAAYAKSFSGWEEARNHPEVFRREMKKALVYHLASRFPDASLASLQIWRDGPGGEAAAVLSALGIPQATPAWPDALASVPELYRVAAAVAMQGLEDRESPMSFSVPRPVLAENHRLWRGRAGSLAKTGYQVLVAAGFGVVLLALSALALHWTVAAKARTWSGELGKWDEYQKRKASVEAELGGMQEMLARRTTAYASMQAIGATLPPEVWLETWEVESGAGHGLVHRLNGLSLAENRIPEFLANLEKTRQFASVKLKSTERLKGETVEQKTGIQANRKDLVRYQIGVAE